MGSGSSAEVDAHLRKWENAVNDLQTLCSNHRRVIDADRVSPSTGDGVGSDQQHSKSGGAGAVGGNEEGNESERSLRRRASSLVSFGGKIPTDGSTPQPTTGLMVTAGDGPSAHALTPRGSTAGANVVIGGDHHGGDTPAKHLTKHHSRQQVMEIRKHRSTIFHSYECPKSLDFDNIEGSLACNHFAAVALALSSLLGGGKDNADRRTRVTVEDLFFAAQIPLHMLHATPPNLTVMNDIVREFIDVDNRFKGMYSVETVHLDVAPTLGQVELGSNDVGDRQCKVQLPEFRKNIEHDIEEEADVIRIVNYDPFVLEQGMMVESDDTGDVESRSFTSVNPAGLNAAAGSKFLPQNDGAYAAIIDTRNSVQPMVTLAEGAMSDSLFARITEVPANQLFKAMMASEEGQRARGYIRVSKKNKEKDPRRNEDVALFFTPELCSGNVLGTNVDGANAHAIAPFIAPHIAACAWAMHLICGVRPNTHGHGKGLPVSEIIRSMRLPADVFIDGDLSLDQVYLYFQEYLKHKLLDRNVTLGLYPVLTKISREDAVPTISVFDLESILIDVKNGNEDPEAPQHVMIVQYNANVAHNVLGIAHSPQWCVLVGYDDDTQTARLVDANPKTFSQSWTCPLDRLHMAMTGLGYIMVSRPKESSASQPDSRSSTPSTTMMNQFGVGSLRHVASTVQRRLDLIKEQQQQHGAVFDVNLIPNRLRAFTFPARPFALTTLTMALHQLMGLQTTFEDFVHKLPYDVNALLVQHFPLECAKICLDHMIRVMGCDDQFGVVVKHFDKHSTGKLTFPIRQFTELLNTYVVAGNGTQHAVIASFDPSLIHVHGVAHPFGTTAMIVAFHEDESSVTLVDANPNLYLRCWTVPIEVIHRAMQNAVGGGHRTNGAVVISRLQEKPTRIGNGRLFDLSLLPVQNVFHISPSPQVQGLSLSFAQLGFFFTPEEIFYEAYLKTMSDQRRRGSQAFAWRDVEVSLAIVNKKIDARIMTLVSKKFIESRKLSGIYVEQLDDLDASELPKILAEATEQRKSDTVLLVNYNTQSVHGLSNMGSSVALVQSYDADKELVELVDAEYTLFGWTWTASISQLIEAADIDNDGSSPYGFVRMSRRASVQGGSLGKGFAVFGGADASNAEPGTNSADNSTTQDQRLKGRGATTFVEEAE